LADAAAGVAVELKMNVALRRTVKPGLFID
jgi:hypothetical protein